MIYFFLPLFAKKWTELLEMQLTFVYYFDDVVSRTYMYAFSLLSPDCMFRKNTTVLRP